MHTMNTFSYNVSEATERQLMLAAFWVSLGLKWIVILAFLVGGGVMLTTIDEPMGVYLGWALLVAGVILCIQWVKAYFSFMTVAKISSDLRNDPKVTVTVAEDFIKITTKSSTRQIQWSKINRHVATDEALLLYSKKLIVVMIPRKDIPREMEPRILAAVQ
jgi:hypothetical protein